MASTKKVEYFAAVRYGGDLQTEVVPAAMVLDFYPSEAHQFDAKNIYTISTSSWNLAKIEQKYLGIIEGVDETREKAESARKQFIRTCDPVQRKIMLDKLRLMSNYPLSNSSDAGEGNDCVQEVEMARQRAAKISANTQLHKQLVNTSVTDHGGSDGEDEEIVETDIPVRRNSKKRKKMPKVDDPEAVSKARLERKAEVTAKANSLEDWNNVILKAATTLPSVTPPSHSSVVTVTSTLSNAVGKQPSGSGSSAYSSARTVPTNKESSSSCSSVTKSSSSGSSATAASTSKVLITPSELGAATIQLNNSSKANRSQEDCFQHDFVCKYCNAEFHGNLQHVLHEVQENYKTIISMLRNQNQTAAGPSAPHSAQSPLVHGKEVINGKVLLGHQVSCSEIGWRAMHSCRDIPDWCTAILNGVFGHEEAMLYRLKPRYLEFKTFSSDFLGVAGVYYEEFLNRRISQLRERLARHANDLLAAKQMSFFLDNKEDLLRQLGASLADRAESMLKQHELYLVRSGLPIPPKTLKPTSAKKEKTQTKSRKLLTTPKSLEPRKQRQKKVQFNIPTIVTTPKGAPNSVVGFNPVQTGPPEANSTPLKEGSTGPSSSRILAPKSRPQLISSYSSGSDEESSGHEGSLITRNIRANETISSASEDEGASLIIENGDKTIQHLGGFNHN